jgi:ribosomal protein S18 acetylase RimI-like enzyme
MMKVKKVRSLSKLEFLNKLCFPEISSIDPSFLYAYAVINDQNEQVAHACVYKDERSITNSLEIANVCVHPDWRGQGVAGILLNKLLNDHNKETFYVWVNPDNRPAVHLYEHLGFQEVSSQFSESSPNNLILMTR